MRALAAFLVIAIALASMPAAAQDGGYFEVPSSGYSSTDTLWVDTANLYSVSVPKNHDLVFRFNVVGAGEIMVYLIPENNPEDIRYYTSQPVTEYSAMYPAIIGFDRDYTIMVESSHPGDVQYSVSIHSEPADVPDYTLHYILILLGFVALVVFCWKFVVWQERKEREEKKKNDRGKKRM